VEDSESRDIPDLGAYLQVKTICKQSKQALRTVENGEEAYILYSVGTL
jgi:hypothetical protein